MSNQNVADYLLDRLRTWGIQHVFAFPGDGINGILAAGAVPITNRSSSSRDTRR